MGYSVKTDRKWQKKWDDWQIAHFNPERIDKKLYVLEMFSYPSGANLHVGHWYNYALTDSWARLKKMQGHEVFQPMGFDAFGLPAENYAIQTGIHPQDSTLRNIETMTRQLREMGGLFNWEHTLATCTPDYYRWNQWLFLQLYKNGLAYRDKAPVNWCPECNTVLANEQVEGDGTCERCHTEVEHRKLTQWFFRITDYAQELLDCLDDLDWPDKTKKIQTNWIGRSEGANITFGAVKAGQTLLDQSGEPVALTVFTTRTDTLFGVTCIVVAPESDLTPLLTTEENRDAVEAYVSMTNKATEIDRQATTREKTGVFTGSYAVHPLTGQHIPIWIADYVIASYGTGVVMMVPGHDTRDHEFADQMGLPIVRVINHPDGSESTLPYNEYGVLVNSGQYSGLDSETALQTIVDDLQKQGRGERCINYRLRDWLVSRQRYWGTPIPMIHCPACGVVPVPETELPVELPYDVAFTPDGESPLRKSRSFIETTCPTCGGPAERDPDTLDTFVCSSWYQFRFVDNRNDQAPFDREKVNAMCPVDKYVGGAEHAVMHLLYARFITKALRDLGHLDFDEPFQSLVHQGTILGPDGMRMSKSRGNTISPDSYIDKYGSDVFRLYLGFGFAYTEGGPWSDTGVQAIVKFVNRIEALADQLQAAGKKTRASGSAEAALNFARHHAIKSVTTDADRFQFNTSIARLMELLNALQKYLGAADADPAYARQVFLDFIRLLAPFAPHFAEEQWEKLGHQTSIFLESWPAFDPAALIRDTVEIAVQINGQIKHRLDIPSQATQEEVIQLVKDSGQLDRWLEGRTVRKWIYVPRRLLNIVL